MERYQISQKVQILQKSANIKKCNFYWKDVKFIEKRVQNFK